MTFIAQNSDKTAMAIGKKTGGRDFNPGESGNPGGRPKTKIFAEALRKALGDPEERNSRFSTIIEALIIACEDKNIQAIKELADRIDGKPEQPISGQLDTTFRLIRDPKEEGY